MKMAVTRKAVFTPNEKELGLTASQRWLPLNKCNSHNEQPAIGFIDWLGDCRLSRCAVLPEERIEVEVAWRATCDAVLS